jgi:hypothetical protein
MPLYLSIIFKKPDLHYKFKIFIFLPLYCKGKGQRKLFNNTNDLDISGIVIPLRTIILCKT